MTEYIQLQCKGCKEPLDIFLIHDKIINPQTLNILCMECYMRLENDKKTTKPFELTVNVVCQKCDPNPPSSDYAIAWKLCVKHAKIYCDNPRCIEGNHHKDCPLNEEVIKARDDMLIRDGVLDE